MAQSDLLFEPPTPGLRIDRREIDGVWELSIQPQEGAALPDGPLGVIWRLPTIDIAGMWHSGLYRDRSLRADWSGGMASHATVNAPVVCLMSQDGTNRLTFACSEALRPVELFAGVVEETGMMRCEARLMAPRASLARGPVRVRLDRRPVTYRRALGDASDWWAAMPHHRPSPVPDVARRPMYSTWYSFHQALDADAVVRQCALARELGCEAVIVDDGWQADLSNKGYGTCGDWESMPSKLGDMRAFAGRIHQLGMKALLWYALPWVGPQSKAWARLEKLTLRHVPAMDASVLDPRYPAVREHLIETATRAIGDWDLDGLKLDFVDRWHDDGNLPPANARMDHANVYDAADRLLSDLMERLRAVKPDVMIEFRQRYIGPLMRKYGNLFRAGDCPADSVTNRVRTIDVRLLAGASATHSDMLMWHPDEPVEAAARQLLNVLFSVPQISVLLDRIPESHRRMLRFWLGFWNEHRPTLLDGTLEPASPLGLYPIVSASDAGTHIAAVYDDAVVRLPDDLPPRCFLINATSKDRLVIEAPAGLRRVRTLDVTGRQVAATASTLGAGAQSIPVPVSGLVELNRA